MEHTLNTFKVQILTGFPFEVSDDFRTAQAAQDYADEADREAIAAGRDHLVYRISLKQDGEEVARMYSARFGVMFGDHLVTTIPGQWYNTAGIPIDPPNPEGSGTGA